MRFLYRWIELLDTSQHFIKASLESRTENETMVDKYVTKIKDRFSGSTVDGQEIILFI